MMATKLLRCNSWGNNNELGNSRVLRVLLYYCTDTLTSSSSSSSSSRDTLFGRLTPFGSPRVSIAPVLDQWVREGRTVKQEQLRIIIRQLRNSKRFKHALEVSEWMTNKRYLDLLPGDVAVRLDLISKVRGLEQAEKYFNNIHITFRGLRVYGALLNCYVHAKSLEKAEATMEKMRELGFAITPLPYNAMLKLYSDMGKHEKLDPLIQEMEEKGITCDKFTLNTRLNAYVTASDMEGMEKLLMKMEDDPKFTMEWNSFIVAANGYLRAGVVEKALAMVKKSEQVVSGKVRTLAYEVILTLYASMGDKNEVYRVWNLVKQSGKIRNMGYLSMISSLLKLDDLDGAQKIWEEWDAERTYFDFRIPNVLINAYCKKGLLGNAESILNRVIESGEEPPNASIRQCLAAGYLKDGQMEKAVETMKKAILASHSGWKPNLATLSACLEYLKGKGSEKVAEELVELLREKDLISTEFCGRLTNYIESGNPALLAPDMVGGDDQALDEERGRELKVGEY